MSLKGPGCVSQRENLSRHFGIPPMFIFSVSVRLNTIDAGKVPRLKFAGVRKLSHSGPTSCQKPKQTAMQQ